MTDNVITHADFVDQRGQRFETVCLFVCLFEELRQGRVLGEGHLASPHKLKGRKGKGERCKLPAIVSAYELKRAVLVIIIIEP